MQLDLFAAAVPSDPAPVRDTSASWKVFHARAERARTAGEFETLTWGHVDAEGRTSFGKPGLVLQFWYDAHGQVPGWRYRSDLSLPDQGSTGPFSHFIYPSRNAAMLSIFRVFIRDAASCITGAEIWDSDRRKAVAYRKLIAWCLKQAPPLLSGVYLADEFRDAIAASEAMRVRQKAMWAEKQRIHDLMSSALDAALPGPYHSGRGDIYDPDEIEWKDRFVGEYHISGTMPSLEVVIYSRGSDPRSHLDPATESPMIEKVRAVLAAALDVPVRRCTKDEERLCKSDRERVIW